MTTHNALSVAIVCFPSYGGSGVIATELGLGMAERGHDIHILSSALPVRLQESPIPLRYHPIQPSNYPLFPYPPYIMALASKIVELHRQAPFDIVHVHYAVPHATGAYLAQQILDEDAPKVVLSLHGTDVTHTGKTPEHLPVLQLALRQCDGITTPTDFLKRAAYRDLQLPETLPIEVLPNFVDIDHFRPNAAELPEKTAGKGLLLKQLGAQNGMATEPLLIHVSNFRPLKRVRDVIEIFAQVNAQRPTQLLMLGDGPERLDAIAYTESLGLSKRVHFLGYQRDVVPFLQHCDVMLLPSEAESFGLAALEALSCGVPVVASDVGGLPELITHDSNGYLAAVGDIDSMAKAVLRLLKDPQKAQEMGKTGRYDVETHWSRTRVLERYEEFYQHICGASPRTARRETSLPAHATFNPEQ